MARITRRKYWKRKGRWSSNIKTLTNQEITTPANSSFFVNSKLCENPVQVENTVSQQFTVKNIELSFELSVSASEQNYSVVESLTGYIMYVPEGITVTETYPNTHPEYIMAYRFFGSAFNDTSNCLPARIKTRMSRRLQTGDKIILLIVGQNTGNTNQKIEFNGLVRWWTKAN